MEYDGAHLAFSAAPLKSDQSVLLASSKTRPEATRGPSRPHLRVSEAAVSSEKSRSEGPRPVVQGWSVRRPELCRAASSASVRLEEAFARRDSLCRSSETSRAQSLRLPRSSRAAVWALASFRFVERFGIHDEEARWCRSGHLIDRQAQCGETTIKLAVASTGESSVSDGGCGSRSGRRGRIAEPGPVVPGEGCGPSGACAAFCARNMGSGL